MHFASRKFPSGSSSWQGDVSGVAVRGGGGRRRCRTGGAVGGVTELASWATKSCNRSVNHLSNALATLPLIALPHAIFASFTPPFPFLPLPPHLLFVHVQWEIQFPKATIIQESKVLAHARKPTAIGLAPPTPSLSLSLLLHHVHSIYSLVYTPGYPVAEVSKQSIIVACSKWTLTYPSQIEYAAWCTRLMRLLAELNRQNNDVVNWNRI